MAEQAIQSSGVSAWILELDTELFVAVGELEMVHLIQLPTVFDIPQSPFYCREVVVWESGIIPVMDLLAWLEGYALPREYELLGVLAYQPQPGAPIEHGALPLATIPVQTSVRDDQACELPGSPPGWQEIAISCYKDNDRVIPILDLPYIFSKALLNTPD